MQYQFIEERQEGKRTIRLYRNTQGTEVKTYKIYKDAQGKEWFGFVDLHKIPYLRIAYAKHIIDLYNTGLSLADILEWCNEEKRLLKSDDPEKYEKLFSMILEKEKVAKITADPIRQHLALCTVYVMADDERIDYFDDGIAELKLKLWAADPEAAAFFLSWHTNHIQDSLNRLGKISQTVSLLQKITPPKM